MSAVVLGVPETIAAFERVTLEAEAAKAAPIALPASPFCAMG